MKRNPNSTAVQQTTGATSGKWNRLMGGSRIKQGFHTIESVRVWRGKCGDGKDILWKKKKGKEEKQLKTLGYTISYAMKS